MISCQITYFPLNTTGYLEEIDQVLELIKSYSVEYEIGILSTTIKGSKETVFKLIQDIYNVMDRRDYHFTINILLSNTCGC